MPWHDWQFWLVTLAAAYGLWALVRQLVPRRGRNEPPCSKCAVGPVAGAQRERPKTPPKAS